MVQKSARASDGSKSLIRTLVGVKLLEDLTRGILSAKFKGC